MLPGHRHPVGLVDPQRGAGSSEPGMAVRYLEAKVHVNKMYQFYKTFRFIRCKKFKYFQQLDMIRKWVVMAEYQGQILMNHIARFYLWRWRRQRELPARHERLLRQLRGRPRIAVDLEDDQRSLYIRSNIYYTLYFHYTVAHLVGEHSLLTSHSKVRHSLNVLY